MCFCQVKTKCGQLVNHVGTKVINSEKVERILNMVTKIVAYIGNTAIMKK